MRLDDLPTSDRIEDRRGLPGGRAGLGVGTVVILGLLAWAFGIDPRVLIGGAETMSRNGQTQQQTDAGSTGAPSDDMGRFLSAILGSTEVEWKDTFAQAGKAYEPPTLVMFSGAPVGLRVCASRNGSVLLSDRPESLPRHTVLSGPRASLPGLRYRK